jgi:hypothetical protein
MNVGVSGIASRHHISGIIPSRDVIVIGNFVSITLPVDERKSIVA